MSGCVHPVEFRRIASDGEIQCGVCLSSLGREYRPSASPIRCAKCGKRFAIVPTERACSCGSTQFKHELSDQPYQAGKDRER